MFKKILPYLILFLIFGIALVLRFYNLSEFPVGFHIDEANLGYNAYSLLLTGKDDSGKALPLYISMFGDNNPTGYNYLDILPIKFFGLTEFATRFPGALFGSLTVFAIFLLSFSIFRDKKISILSALLVAIAPWSINLSRGSSESLVSLFFVVFGFSLILWSFYNQKLKLLIFGSLLLLASFFIYPTPRLFLPLLFAAFIIFFLKDILKKEKIYSISLSFSFLFLLVSSLVLIFLVSGGTGRFNQVSVFGFPETKLVMEEQIREDGVMKVKPMIARIFHNKPINFSLSLISNYFQYFTADFLFLKGGLPKILIVPGIGLIYIVELPFILYGLILMATSKKKFYKIPMLWLLIAPITAAITVDDSPNVRRSLVMFPALEMIAAFGIINFLKEYSSYFKRLIISVTIIFFLFNFFYFLHQYFINAKVHRPWYRNNGFPDMIRTVMKSYNNVDKIIITKDTGGVYPLLLFYTKFDPKIYQKYGTRDTPYTGFDKFFFVPQACPSSDRDNRFPIVKHVIYIDNGTCTWDKSLATKKYFFINREDGTKAFRIVYD